MTLGARSTDDCDQKILRECAARAACAVPSISRRRVLYKEFKYFSALPLHFVGSCRYSLAPVVVAFGMVRDLHDSGHAVASRCISQEVFWDLFVMAPEPT